MSVPLPIASRMAADPSLPGRPLFCLSRLRVKKMAICCSFARQSRVARNRQLSELGRYVVHRADTRRHPEKLQHIAVCFFQKDSRCGSTDDGGLHQVLLWTLLLRTLNMFLSLFLSGVAGCVVYTDESYPALRALWDANHGTNLREC